MMCVMTKTNSSSSDEDGNTNQGGETSSSSPSAASNRHEQEELPPPAQQQHQHDLNLASRPKFFPRRTDHSYHDFSTFIEDGGRIEKHTKCKRNFPACLHAMLSDEQYSHIISWMPHGRAWKVLNKKLLVEEAIPKFFGQSQFASFTRQLSGWGFKRLHQTGPDFGCYYHECFLRGHPRLTNLMRRISPGKGKATPNTQSEPDFYEIARLYPLENSAGVARKAAAAPPDIDMESLSTRHHWDPYQRAHHWDSYQRDPRLPTHREAAHTAAVNQYDGNTASHQPTKSSVGQYHSFASSTPGVISGSETKKEGEDQTESDAKDVMAYDPFSVSNHQLGSYRGYQYQADTNQYYGSNVMQMQYAAGIGYYYPQPQHSQSQQRDAHNYNRDYWYRNAHYYNHYSAQQIQGHAQPSPPGAHANAAQLNYPAQDVRDHNSHLPNFSPVKK